MGSRSNSSGYTIMRKTADLTVVATIQERTAARVSASRDSRCISCAKPLFNKRASEASCSLLRGNFKCSLVIKISESGGREQKHGFCRSKFNAGRKPGSFNNTSYFLLLTNFTEITEFFFPTGLGNCTQSQSYQYLVQGTWYLCSKSLF